MVNAVGTQSAKAAAPSTLSHSGRGGCNPVTKNQRHPLFLQRTQPGLVFSFMGKAVGKGMGIPFTAVVCTRLLCVAPTARLCSYNFS